MEKFKVLLLSIIGTLAVVITIMIFMVFWNIIFIGNLQVSQVQYNVEYTLDGKKQIYSGDKLFKNISTGKHKISAKEKSEGYYIPQDFEVIVERKKVTSLEINLKPRAENPDVSGEEIGT